MRLSDKKAISSINTRKTQKFTNSFVKKKVKESNIYEMKRFLKKAF